MNPYIIPLSSGSIMSFALLVQLLLKVMRSPVDRILGSLTLASAPPLFTKEIYK